MNIEDIHKSKTVGRIIVSIGIVILVLGILRVGISIGYYKARFAGQFGNNFERNFLGQRDGVKMFFMGNDIPGGHGAVGEIMNINLPQLVISGPDNLEKTVIVATSTVVRRFQENLKSSDLKVGEFVVVLGNPNDSGQVEAKLIRIMPAPSEEFNRGMMR
jgi:hypothetical protein